MSKKLGIPILLFLLLITGMLFFGDFLTGRLHHEFENPYCRTGKIVENKLGFTHTDIQPSAEMEKLCYDELKMPREEKWARRKGSYRIEKFTGRRIEESGDIPPVTFLDPKVEADFIHYVPQNPKLMLALLHSLYTERKQGTDLESIESNARLDKVEAERVKFIIYWNGIVRNDATVIPPQWWKQNAKKFGLTPEGDVFEDKQISVKSKTDDKPEKKE